MKENEIQDRPFTITFVCGLIALNLFAGILPIKEVFQTGIDQYFIYLVATWVASLIFLIGFWKMKKWSVIFFLFTSSLSQVYLLSSQYWDISFLLMPSLIMFIGLMNFKKMT